MRWSQLKQRVESFLAPSVAGRVELRATRYHAAHDQEGRGWITVDGEEVWSFATTVHRREQGTLAKGIQQANGATDFRDPEWLESYYSAHDAASGIVLQRGLLRLDQFYEALHRYPQMTVEDALDDDSVLIRALAVVDRRLGKRRLSRLRLRANEHELVRRLYALRCGVEGIAQAQASDRRRVTSPKRSP